MSKSILVIDTPESCVKCELSWMPDIDEYDRTAYCVAGGTLSYLEQRGQDGDCPLIV